MTSAKPAVLVFDVNETLLDIESMTPLFAETFGDPAVLREWFNQLVLYSMATTLSDHYTDFSTLAGSVLQMVAGVHGVKLSDEDKRAVQSAMRSMPPHRDVEQGLKLLGANGFRLITLTNSPPGHDGRSAVDRAGLSQFFERQFSVHDARLFKPATRLYRDVADELDVEPATCMMVAAHPWDIIGAQRVGYTSALITRPGNAELRVDGLPEATMLARDIIDLADQLGQS